MNATTTSIYRSDHILGLVDGELSVDLYRHWGRALAQMLPERAVFAVTSDLRKSSEEFRIALIESLTFNGIQVFDLGALPSDLASYGAETVGAAGFASVTGGSWPASWNGLRWWLRNRSLSMSEQVEKFRVAARDPTVVPLSTSPGVCRQLDITYSWISWLQSVWFDSPETNGYILLDSIYDTWGDLTQKALQAVFSHLVFDIIRDEPRRDSGNLDFPPRYSDALCTAMKRRHADLGVVFDADEGQFTIVDGNGIPLRPEELSLFFLRDLLGPALEGEVFLHDVHCPQTILDEALRWGATPVPVRRGDHFFTAGMKETNALIGLDCEGGIYFRGAQGNRIVLFAVCWLIDYLATNGKELAEWRKTFPPFYTTPEIRLPADSRLIVDRLTEAWTVLPEPLIEGVRFSLPGGRLHARPIPDFSRTGLFFEAENRRELDRIVAQTVSVLENVESAGSALAERYAGLTKTWRCPEE